AGGTAQRCRGGPAPRGESPSRTHAIAASDWQREARDAVCQRADQADSSLRPLVRRAARMARPARVRIRSRKPCVLARRRLLGWKVRLPLLTAGSPGADYQAGLWMSPADLQSGAVRHLGRTVAARARQTHPSLAGDLSEGTQYGARFSNRGGTGHAERRA